LGADGLVFNDELVELIASQSDAQSGHMTIRELERLRDDNLVGIIRALKQSGSGAGGTIKQHETTLSQANTSSEGLPITGQRHYLEIASLATDRFMKLVGCTEEYVAAGQSYFTVENHVCYLSELHQGDQLTVSTQLLNGEGKKIVSSFAWARYDCRCDCRIIAITYGSQGAKNILAG